MLQFAKIPGWSAFVLDTAARVQLTSTPGWENGSERPIETEDGPVAMPHYTRPGAKAIGLAQWGVAISTAGLISLAVPGVSAPYADANPDGSIVLTWAFSDSEGLSLTLRANLLQQNYEWTQMIDGAPRSFTDNDPGEVIASLKAVVKSAKAKSTDTGGVPR